MNILVVDDEKSIRSMISLTLEDEGYQVTQAMTAEEAVLHCLKETYDLVITDIRMRGMNGIELLEKICSISPDTRVVVITSHSSDNFVQRALDLGAFDFIEKPFRDLYEISYLAKRVADDIQKDKAANDEPPKDDDKKPETIVKAPAQTSTAPTPKPEPAKADLKVVPFKPVKPIAKKPEEPRGNKNYDHSKFKNQLLGLHEKEYFIRKLKDETARAHKNNFHLTFIFLRIINFSYLSTEHAEYLDKVKAKITETLGEYVHQNKPVTEYQHDVYALLLPETSEISALIAAERLKLKFSRVARELRKEYKNDVLPDIVSSVTALDKNITPEEFFKKAQADLKNAK